MMLKILNKNKSNFFLMYHNPKLFYNSHVGNFILFYDNVVIMLHFWIKHLKYIPSSLRMCSWHYVLWCRRHEWSSEYLKLCIIFDMFKFTKKSIIFFLSVLAIKNKNWKSLNKQQRPFYELFQETVYKKRENENVAIKIFKLEFNSIPPSLHRLSFVFINLFYDYSEILLRMLYKTTFST